MKNNCVDVQILEKRKKKLTSYRGDETFQKKTLWHVTVRRAPVWMPLCFNTPLFSVFPSKSITSVPCWCWPVPCQGPESTRWTWRWCPLTPWSTTRTTIRQAPPSDSPSTSGRTPFKEEELEGTRRARHRHKQGERSCKTQVVDAVQPVTVMLN